MKSPLKVRVYRNLHKNCFSVVLCKTGKVIAHTEEICLKQVKFVVRKSGRDKVLLTKNKNVHAFVCGYIMDDIEKEDGLVPISYNPYKNDSFYRVDNNQSVFNAKTVKMHSGKYISAII